MQENLADRNIAALEGSGGPGHVEQPDAKGAFGNCLQQGGGLFLEIPDPQSKSLGVVLAEVFYVAHFEAGGFSLPQDFGQGGKLSIRKYEAVDEGVISAWRVVGAKDSGGEKNTAGLEQLVCDPEILSQLLEPNVLEHSDACHLVESFGQVERVTIVPDFDRAAGRQMCVGDAAGGHFGLLLADGDAASFCAVLGSRVEREAAPATPDVNELVTALKP